MSIGLFLVHPSQEVSIEADAAFESGHELRNEVPLFVMKYRIPVVAGFSLLRSSFTLEVTKTGIKDNVFSADIVLF